MRRAPLWIAAGAVLLTAALVAKDGIGAGIVKNSASKLLGAPVEIDRMRIGLLNSSIRLSGFRVMQPRTFPNGPLLDVTEARVDYDLAALLGGEIHVRRAEIRVREVIVIRDRDGKLNVDSLSVAKPASGDTGSRSRFEIGELVLTVEKVVSKDYSKGDKPVVEVWNLPIRDKTYSHLSSPRGLASIVIVEALQSAAIEGALSYAVSGAVGTAFLPLGAAMVLAGGDTDMETVRADYGRAFKAASRALAELGNITLDDKSSGILKAVVNGCEVTLTLKKEGFRKVRITAQARKFLLPQQRIASGVLYIILERLR